ncbi:uncharacterized protein LOC128186004 [Crassostrea angulata]|uniref:uncharacterized protein LOC128186004 n=1 Tax=Magallana angulata TaxID=2784310 RepID=UPI0022B14A2C|nr:uncharacterized protein LOC128186004 [Crassostrea angulata]
MRKIFYPLNEEMKQRKSEKENGRNIHIEEKSFQLKSVNTDRDKIKAIFLDVDKNGNGVLEIDEFCLAMQNFGIEMEKSKAEKMFDSIDVDNNGKITFDEFYDYFVKEILGGNTVSPKIFMEADKKVNGRWNKFAAFKREGENGEIVMTGGTDIVEDVIPGKYNLQELSQFEDLPKLTPKKTVVRVSWESSKNTTASGNLIFPADFDGNLETEIATSELLDYYGCTFADARPETVCIPCRHVIQDFTYKDSYLKNYVEGKNRGAGLERHEFVYLDCPLDDDSGFFVLGKLSEDEFHLTAFRVPKRHTLYVPANCIHSNDYLKGTWRTMLSDESNIDQVFLKRKTKENGENKLQSFTFSFAL